MPSYIFWNNRKRCWYGWYYPLGAKSSKNKKQFSLSIKNKKGRHEASLKYQERLKQLWEEEAAKQIKIHHLSDLLKLRIEERKCDGVLKAQISEIRSTFRLFEKSIGGDLNLRSITEQQVIDFFTKGWNGDKWGKYENVTIFTKRKHLSNLKSGFQLAVRMKWIPDNPCDVMKLNRKVAGQNETDFLTTEDFDFLLSRIDTTKSNNKRLYLMCVIAFWTGLRLNEILHLELNDIDFNELTIHIKQKTHFTPKWGKERYAPLFHKALLAINEQIQLKSESPSALQDSLFLFPTKNGKWFALGTVSSDFKELVRKVFPDREGLHFHSLRHSFAVFQVENGVSLQVLKEWMGHRQIRTTEQYARQRSKVAVTFNRHKLVENHVQDNTSSVLLALKDYELRYGAEELSKLLAIVRMQKAA